MFGLSFGEILIILVVALLVLGPTGMPKLARTLGKGLRDFRRATGDIRGAFENEFYKLDQEVEKVAAATRDTSSPSLEGANAQPVDPAAGIEAPSADGAVPEGAIPHAPAAFAPEGAASATGEVGVAAVPASAAPRSAPEGTAARPPEGVVAVAAPNRAVNTAADRPDPTPAGNRPADESQG